MGFEPVTFYISHVHIITVASLPTAPPSFYMPWSLFIAKSVQLFNCSVILFLWMNLNEWITVLSCYTCFLLDSIHDGQYSYCVRSILYAWINGYCTLLHNIAPDKCIVIKAEYGLQLHFKIFLNKSDRKTTTKIIIKMLMVWDFKILSL